MSWFHEIGPLHNFLDHFINATLIRVDEAQLGAHKWCITKHLPVGPENILKQGHIRSGAPHSQKESDADA